MEKKEKGTIHRKQVSALIFATLIILELGFNGCSPKSSQEHGRYFDKFKGFSIKIPTDWEKTKTPLGMRAIGPRYASGYALASMDVRVAKTTGGAWTLEELYQVSLTDLKEQLDFNLELHEEGFSHIDNTIAKWMVYSVPMEVLARKGITKFILKPPVYKGICYHFLKGRRTYVIGFGSTPDKFSEYRDKFEEIVQSFRFE